MTVKYETERLQIGEYEEKDWEAVYDYSKNMEVVQYESWGPYDEAQTKRYIADSIKSAKMYPRLTHYFPIKTRDVEAPMGGCGLYVKSYINRDASMGYVIHPDYWGKGYATEIVRFMVCYGFQKLKLHRIYATCHTANLGSAKVLEKAGFTKEGCMREHKKIRGEWTSSLLYSILKGEQKDTFDF